jgi:hypothetical protein
MIQRKSLLLLVAVCLVSSAAFAAPAKQTELADRITNIVREYFPEAQIAQDNGVFHASHGTMMFTVHPRSKTGEVYEKTQQVEGPNFKGFILSLSLQEGTYQGAAVVPATLGKPYWATYIDRPLTADGKSHHVINFSYGSRLDAEFKKAIFEALPRTQRETK